MAQANTFSLAATEKGVNNIFKSIWDLIASCELDIDSVMEPFDAGLSVFF